jgi:hypothetical protein
MKKLALTFALTFIMFACSSQERFGDKFKGKNPTIINGDINRIEQNMCGSYTVYVTTKEYGKVSIHYVPCTSYLHDIPVYVGKNRNLHFRKI